MYTASVLLPASVDCDGVVCRYRERGCGRLFRGSSICDQDEVGGEAAGAVRTAVYFVADPNHLSLFTFVTNGAPQLKSYQQHRWNRWLFKRFFVGYLRAHGIICIAIIPVLFLGNGQRAVNPLIFRPFGDIG